VDEPLVADLNEGQTVGLVHPTDDGALALVEVGRDLRDFSIIRENIVGHDRLDDGRSVHIPPQKPMSVKKRSKKIGVFIWTLDGVL
jgi:hypothetical protein